MMLGVDRTDACLADSQYTQGESFYEPQHQHDTQHATANF